MFGRPGIQLHNNSQDFFDRFPVDSSLWIVEGFSYLVREKSMRHKAEFRLRMAAFLALGGNATVATTYLVTDLGIPLFRRGHWN